jgi:2-iminobutanoate/2-iminopropanoate deaminase
MSDSVELGTKTFPFSTALWMGETCYLSGHLGIDLKTGSGPDGPEDEARLMMENFRATIVGAGLVMDDLVSVELFCTDMSLFATFNKVYLEFLTEPYPARAFLGTSGLLFGRRFEILGTAVKGAATEKRRG